MSGIGPMMGQPNVFYRYAPDKTPYAIERYQRETRREGLDAIERWMDLIGARPAVQRGRAVPPPTDLGTGDGKTVEGARKFLA